MGQGQSGAAATYEAITRGVRVRVTPAYAPERSDPARGLHFWTYQVLIDNQGEETVQLVSRHWIISDALDRTEDVRGPGVVGAQPVIKPGEAFSYAFGCPLPTPWGRMRGAYQMVTGTGERFEAEIPAFPLDLPQARRSLN